MGDYAITQDWARTLHGAGFDAIIAALRFSPGPARGLALFGNAGAPAPGLPTDPQPRPVTSLVRALGIEIVGPPHSTQVELDEP